MYSTEIEVRTGSVAVVHDLTKDAETFLHVFVPHATSGLAILETGAGSDDDLLAALDDLLPRDGRRRHQHGSPGPRP